MIKLFSSILIGFCENPKLGSAIAKTLKLTSVTCDADNLAILSLTTQAPTRIA